MFLLSVLKTDSVLIISVYYTLTLCLNIHQGRRHSPLFFHGLKEASNQTRTKVFLIVLKLA